MKKKYPLAIFVLSAILLASLNNSNTYVLAQTPDAPPDNVTRIKQQSYYEVKMFGMRLEIKQPSNHYYQNVIPSTVNVPDVRNQSIARFVGTMSNFGNQIVYMKTFIVHMFNASDRVNPAWIFKYNFPGQVESTVQLGMNTSATFSVNAPLPFKLYDEVYTLTYIMQYSSSLNTTLDLLLKETNNNFTLHSVQNDPVPPEFVVWTWFLLTVALVVQVSLGYYGNRKSKK